MCRNCTPERIDAEIIEEKCPCRGSREGVKNWKACRRLNKLKCQRMTFGVKEHIAHDGDRRNQCCAHVHSCKRRKVGVSKFGGGDTSISRTFIGDACRWPKWRISSYRSQCAAHREPRKRKKWRVAIMVRSNSRCKAGTTELSLPYQWRSSRTIGPPTAIKYFVVISWAPDKMATHG